MFIGSTLNKKSDHQQPGQPLEVAKLVETKDHIKDITRNPIGTVPIAGEILMNDKSSEAANDTAVAAQKANRRDDHSLDKPIPVGNTNGSEEKGKEEGAVKIVIDPALINTNQSRGLTKEEVEKRLQEFGFNEISEKKTNPLLKFLAYFWGSIAFLIEAACILAAVIQDWLDFGIILGLLFINAFIGFIEENRAESAVAALKSTLALRARVMRDGKWQEIEAKYLVPGDIISLRVGDVVGADATVLGKPKRKVSISASVSNRLGEGAQKENEKQYEAEKTWVSVDQSALTGESLPVNKHADDLIYSSSLVKQGQANAVVVKTGEKSFVGRAANLMNVTTDAGHFQKIITKIGNFLVIITLTLVAVILIYSGMKGKFSLTQLQHALVLTIASIPVGMPTVLSVTMAVGAKQLAGRQVIVKRLTAVEEMAGMDILCSDKTGTLTKNQLTTDRPYLSGSYTEGKLLYHCFLASEPATKDAIDSCLRQQAVEKCPELKGLTVSDDEIPDVTILKHEPFNATSKMAVTLWCDEQKQDLFYSAKGAPQVILKMCDAEGEAEQAVIDLAKKGLRALGVARSKPFNDKSKSIDSVEWELVGIVSLLDPEREDSGETIRKCNENGIKVKMITGDNQLIAREIARRLGMDRNILTPQIVQEHEKTRDIDEKQLIHMVERADGFAHVIPEDKYHIVELLQKNNHLVGMTGDGVNDAPALKKANVGIAVADCTDAARSAADIVLLQPGLSTIIDGLLTSRAIFQRMRSYALYRITSTIHFLIFLFIAIMAFDFFLRPVLIVLITVMNDAATLVIAVDNTKVSDHPNKWRIGKLIFLSCLLAILLSGSSFAHFFIARDVFGMDTDSVGTVMYLQMSSAPHFVIFSTRLEGPFWQNMPSFSFMVAVLGTQVIAMFFSIYGVLSAPIGWGWSVTIMAISLLTFMMLDFVKVFVERIWSFELTAKLWPVPSRRKKLAERRAEAAKQERYRQQVLKLKKVFKIIDVLQAFIQHQKNRQTGVNNNNDTSTDQ